MSKILNDLKRRSLMSYIISFSAIVVVIIMIMGTYLYRFYYRTIYEDFLNVNETYLSAICNRHENDMAIANDIMVQMRLAANNVEFKLEESPLKSIALKEQLHRYTSVSRFFNQVYFFYHDDQYLYNHLTSIHINMFLEEGILLENTSKEELCQLLYSEDGGMKVLGEQTIDGYLAKKFKDIAAKVVVFIKPLEPKNTSTLAFIVSDFYYDELLSSDKEEIRNDYIFYDNQVVVSRGELVLDENRLLEEISYREELQFQIRIDGKKYLVTLARGESHLEYCTVQPMKVFQNKIVTGQWGILFVLLICSIPASLLIVALSRRLSKKVRNINALLSEDEESYYDLDHIEIGVRTLVETSKEVNEESLILHRTRFVNQFVRNNHADREEVILHGKKVHMKVDREYYAIALMGDRGNSNENKAHEEMLSEMEHQEGVDGFGIHLINKNQSLFVVFGDSITVLETLLEQLFCIGKKYCEDFIMSASGYHKEFAEASEAYLEADCAFDNRFLVENSRIIFFSDITDREQVELLPDTYLHRLKNAIRANDERDAKMVIQEICARLQTNGQSLLTFRILCNDIIHMMITEWNANDIGFENIYSVFAISQCLTIQDFNDILCEVSCSLMDSKRLSVKKTDMVTVAIDYMLSEYHNPELNMGALAEYLEVSGVTLAVEFKNAMGISPSDYLAIIRVENAKRLLRETKMLVKEISVAVGYEDDNVFTRRFKKYVGKTPGQYRMDCG